MTLALSLPSSDQIVDLLAGIGQAFLSVVLVLVVFLVVISFADRRRKRRPPPRS